MQGGKIGTRWSKVIGIIENIYRDSTSGGVGGGSWWGVRDKGLKHQSNIQPRAFLRCNEYQMPHQLLITITNSMYVIRACLLLLLQIITTWSVQIAISKYTCMNLPYTILIFFLNYLQNFFLQPTHTHTLKSHCLGKAALQPQRWYTPNLINRASRHALAISENFLTHKKLQ